MQRNADIPLVGGHLVPPLLLSLLGENMSLQLSRLGEAKGVAGKKGVPAAEAEPGVRWPAPPRLPGRLSSGLAVSVGT
jgi:hypothetical protein